MDEGKEFQFKARLIDKTNGLSSGWIYSTLLKTIYSLPIIDNMHVVNNDFNSINIEWQYTSNLNIIKSEIYIKDENSKILELKEPTNKFKITNLSSDTFYTIKVRVLNLSGYSDWSEEIKIKTSETLPIWDGLKSFNIKEYYDDSVLLSWNHPKSDTIITKYEIHISRPSEAFSKICEIGSDYLEYKLMNLIQNNEYKIRIYAFNGVGSNYLELSAKLTLKKPIWEADGSNIKIIKHSQNYIMLSHPNIQSWGNEYNTEVFISYNNLGYLKLDKYIKSNNTLTLFNIRGNTIFKFKLLIKNEVGTSTIQSSAFFIQYAVPVWNKENEINISKIDNDYLSINWPEPYECGNPIIKYLVKIRSYDNEIYHKYETKKNNYTFDNLKKNKKYQIIVEAYNKIGKNTLKKDINLTTIKNINFHGNINIRGNINI